MGVYGVIVTFTVVWWLTLFTVLPWGVRSQAEDGQIQAGTDPGAPKIPSVKKKLLITTILSLVIWGSLAYAFERGFVTLDDLPGYKPHDYYSDIMKSEPKN
jgi:predicted secreted protein